MGNQGALMTAYIRAYNSVGDEQTILLRIDSIVTLFNRYRDKSNRNPDQHRRAGWTVEATIDTSYDGPTYTLAICPTTEIATALRDTVAAAVGDGTFDDGGIWSLDDTEGLFEDNWADEE